MGECFDLSSENVLALWTCTFLEQTRTNESCFRGGGGDRSRDPALGICHCAESGWQRGAGQRLPCRSGDGTASDWVD